MISNYLKSLISVWALQPQKSRVQALPMSVVALTLACSIFFMIITDLVALIACGLFAVSAVGFSLMLRHDMKLFGPQNFKKLCFAVAVGMVPAFLMLASGANDVVSSLFFAHGFIAVSISHKHDAPAPEAPKGDQPPAISAQAARQLRALPNVEFVDMGPAIGRFAGHEIPGWLIDSNGMRHRFVSVISRGSHTQLQHGQSLVAPGLIYEIDAEDQASITQA